MLFWNKDNSHATADIFSVMFYFILFGSENFTLNLVQTRQGMGKENRRYAIMIAK